MARCPYCNATTENLAHTATRRWIGCRACGRTWTEGTYETERVAVSDCAPFMGAWWGRGLFIATFGVLLAFGVRIALRPLIGSASPFLMFTPAVAIAALYGGGFSGAFATAASAILGSHFFLRALGEPALANWDRTILFVIVGTVITASSSYVQRARAELSRGLWREQKARALAEAADRGKDDLLALISHELRSPTSVILGRASMLRTSGYSTASLPRAIDAIERNGQMIARLIEDLLEQSRIATGTLHPDPQPISLTTVLHASIDQVRAKIEGKEQTLQQAWPDEDVRIVGDSIRLQQVFTNLLSNSIKFTPARGRIRLELARTGAGAEVKVVDTGTGIDREFLPHVFEPFRQSGRTRGDSQSGLGLGLSVARHIVERHNGTICVDSGGAGCGATFTITLPRLDPRIEPAILAPTPLIH
jgi:signal transduction histidine kinase